MNIISTAIAETTLTTEEAAAAGMVLGSFGVIAIIWFVLQVIADWKIFTKAGRAGWKSIIPFYNSYVEYDLCWNGLYGLLFVALAIVGNLLNQNPPLANWKMILIIVLSVVSLIIHIIESLKLAKAFGKGTGFGVCLILFGPIARMVLGFGSARYVGKEN